MLLISKLVMSKRITFLSNFDVLLKKITVAKTWVSTINVVINLPLTEPSTFMDQYPLFPSKPHQVLKMNKDELDLG